MSAAAIPVRADPSAAGCNELVEQVRHRAVATVQGDQFVAAVCRLPIAWALTASPSIFWHVSERPHRSNDEGSSYTDRMMSKSVTTHTHHIVPLKVRCGGQAFQYDAHGLDCW